MELKKLGRPFINKEIVEKIRNLKKGETLIVRRDEWQSKNPPANHMFKRVSDHLFSVRSLADGSGWVISIKE